MNAIDEYNQLKNKVARFESWASLIGKEYFGETRGKGGKYGEIVSASGNLTVYHQAWDGANNYHDLDKEFHGILELAMKEHSHILIESMRKSLNKQLEIAKQKAAELVKELNVL